MTDKNTIRAYILRDNDAMVEKFASNNNITKQEAHNTIILNSLDANGNLKDRILLIKEQLDGVDKISKSLGQSTVKTTQDLIDCALLLFGTDLTLRDTLVFSLPLLRERFKDLDPDLAGAMLNR